jgi:hypothetical protein
VSCSEEEPEQDRPSVEASSEQIETIYPPISLRISSPETLIERDPGRKDHEEKVNVWKG